MKINRSTWLLALLFIPALWWAWPSSPDLRHKPESSGGGVGNSIKDGLQTQIAGESARTRSGRRVRQQRPDTQASSPEVNRILVDEGVSNGEAAMRLRALAANRSLPTNQRVDALEHGMNLDAAAFVDFAAEPELPAGLATRFLDEMENHNESATIRIRGFLTLMDHPDKDVSTQARELLKFQLDEEFDEPSRERLVQLAREQLATAEAVPAEE